MKFNCRKQAKRSPKAASIHFWSSGRVVGYSAVTTCGRSTARKSEFSSMMIEEWISDPASTKIPDYIGVFEA